MSHHAVKKKVNQLLIALLIILVCMVIQIIFYEISVGGIVLAVIAISAISLQIKFPKQSRIEYSGVIVAGEIIYSLPADIYNIDFGIWGGVLVVIGAIMATLTLVPKVE